MKDGNGQTEENQSPPASHDNVEDTNKCPCRNEDEDSKWICCDTCSQWLHCNCVGLNGLDKPAIELLTHWQCPKCLISPYTQGLQSSDDVVTKGELMAVCSLLRTEMTTAVTSLKVTVTEAAEKAVKNAAPTVVSGVVEQTKSYAAAAQDNQRKLLEEYKAAATSSQLVDKICKKMDNDSVQREKKKRNILVSNVPEPDIKLSGAKRKDADIIYMCQNFNMERNEIVNCFRTGAVKTDDKGNSVPRPIVAVMLDEESACYWHNDGKGYKIGTSWINPDLCRVDRENQFLARQERRNKKVAEAKKGPEKKEAAKKKVAKAAQK